MNHIWGNIEDAYSAERISKNGSLLITANLEKFGLVHGKEKEWIGTRGEAKRLEGFSIKRHKLTDSFEIRYEAHLEGWGDAGEKKEGEFIGTKGESRRLEGFSIKLVQQKGPLYNVFYQGHLENTGDTGIYKNGEFCGTKGQSRRVEAIKVWIELAK